MAEHQVASGRESLATAKEAAAYLRLEVSTLANWRSNGTGPKYLNIGGRAGIRYHWDDIHAWVASRTKAANSTEGANRAA